MKKLLSTLFTLTLALPVAAFAQGTLKIGTVDMQRACKEYNKTKEAEVKINDAKNAAKKEYDDRAEAYKKALDEINNLNKQLESTALSADKKTQVAKDRDDKIASIKRMEQEISDFRQTRERQLQEQLMRVREGIVKEITDVVVEKVKTKNLDLVLDKSGMSINGVPVVMYAPVRWRRIGRRRSAKIRLGIFPSCARCVRSTASDGRDLPLLPERSILQSRPEISFNSMERAEPLAWFGCCGNWMRPIARWPT